MLTKNEITALSLSPTKKDFVQIWNELLEVAGKLSERWDPTSTNESDPGIVILKALTGIADKLNYNIDKNTLEAFMPTAAQEDSMRKLCEMLGYTMKYYRSAETKVNIKYYNVEPSEDESNIMAAGLYIPKFTTITNSDQDISYFTTKSSPMYISTDSPSLLEIPCMEGQIVKCESIGGTNVILSSHISENNRFYLPETQIAENGIFVYNVSSVDFDGASLADGTEWLRVDNLNTQAHGTRVFKFGYDSYESRPYLEFPDDYSELFQDGLAIYYTRTSGAAGNISHGTLTQINLPGSGDWSKVSAASFSVENLLSATSGANPETIKQAYNNFKKTIGTFDTLVTCRDYMNKIYSMMNDSTGKSVVSNILVTDIRNDLNNAVTICSCDDAGIFYKETPVLKKVKENTVVNANVTTKIQLNTNKPVYSTSSKSWHLGSENGMELVKSKFISSNASNFNTELSGEVFADSGTDYYWAIKQNGIVFKTKLLAFEDATVKLNNEVEVEIDQPAITHFDLVFYPFKSYSQIKSNAKDIKAAYDSSFTYHADSLKEILLGLDSENIKNISHNIKEPAVGDILCINNYLRLSATIVTSAKVTEVERSIIVDNIKIALANAFNMRELDFGDEIPFDSIIDVIENADTRIRIASLNEPALYTTFSVLEADINGKPVVVEYAVASDWLDAETADSTGRFTKVERYTDINGNSNVRSVSTFNTRAAREIYNKLAVRNVLAGRVPLFNYDNTFNVSFSESAYQVTKLINVRNKPAELTEPTMEQPFTTWTDGTTTYTGQLLLAGSDDFTKYVYSQYAQPVFEDDDIKQNKIGVIVYTCTGVPKEYTTIPNNNVITGNIDNDSQISDYKQNSQYSDDLITNIKTSCKLFTDDDNRITDLTLAEGEFVKFRAPNFITKKTYPAYVNYHLDLAKNIDTEARAAKAKTLFSILDGDKIYWSTSNTDVRWQKMLDYFTENASAYKKTFSLSNTVSAFKETDDKIQTSTTILGLDLSQSGVAEHTISELIALSGCVKLTNSNMTARVEWTPAEGETAPATDIASIVNLAPLSLTTPFITDISYLNNLLDELNDALMLAASNPNTTLPRDCSWTIYFDFECVPFEPKSITAWESFISNCAQSFDNNYIYQIFDFKPLAENNSYLWRTAEGSSYEIGKYITDDYKKLLNFSKNYFTTIQAAPLANIYIVEDFGTDKKLNRIFNKEEYTLRSDDRLFIEYTPASTTDDPAATSGVASITEVYGEGTTIRPSGFANGLSDSAESANTTVKTVTFGQISNSPISMFSLGASEQIEIRELAAVELSKDSFSGAGVVYLYKNFNNCPELEKKFTDAHGVRVNNTYTLKDGEYIFYTDANKADFAYYTSGTQVTLSGNIVLPEFDIIELSTVFDSGVQAIPWVRRELGTADKIVFQEFQYITLGPGDTIKNVRLISAKDEDGYDRKFLDENWQYCDSIDYATSSAPADLQKLQPVSTANRLGNGWEACATLELNVTPKVAQTLRRSDKVETSLILSCNGSSSADHVIIPPALAEDDAVSEVIVPVSFKTNVACHTAGSSISIDDLYGSNTASSFKVRVFASDSPAVVDVLADSVAPYSSTGIVDIASWPGEALTTKTNSDSWSSLLLSKISSDATERSYGVKTEKALRLPINVLQDTYCVFCIYLNAISALDSANSPVWIEVTPGMPSDAVMLLNSELNDKLDITTNRLYLTQGINCLRVNKTCKLFIKADKGTDGLLFFDEPRLVSCEELRYKDPTGNLVSLYTSGLNLAQLGYLDTSYDNSGKIDEATRNTLFKAYADKATESVTKAIQNIHKEISVDLEKLAELMPDVKAVVTAEALMAADLENLKQANIVQLDSLITQYNKANHTLASEKALLDALKNNVKADEIEQRIVELLDGLEIPRLTRTKVIEELSDIKVRADLSAEAMPDPQVLLDFIELATKIDLSEPFENILSLATDYVEESYQKQLATLIDKLDSLVNSDDKTKLMTALEKLRASELVSVQLELQVLAAQLSELLEQDSVNNILSEITEAATSANYIQLYSLIVTLDGLLGSRGLAAISTELGRIAANIDDESIIQLNSLANELRAIIDSIDSSAKNTISSELAALAVTVKAHIEAGTDTVAPEVIAAVDAICEKFAEEYDGKLSEIANNLDKYIDEIDKDTDIKTLISIINALYDSSTDDSRVKRITDSILAAITERKKRLDSLRIVKYDTWQASAAKDFISSAIITLWPTNFTTRLSELLTDIEAVFISTLDKKYDFSTGSSMLSTLCSIDKATNTNVLLGIIDVDAFSGLFDKVLLALSEDSQNTADKTLLATLSGFIENSEELREALINKPENSIIQILLEEWQATKNIIRKQQLQKVIKDELTRAIGIDEQIFNIVSELLLPNISKLEADLDTNNSFYAEIAAAIAKVKQLILSKTFNSSLLADDRGYLELLQSADPKTALISFTKPTLSLLSTDFTSAVDNLQLKLSKVIGDADLLKSNPINGNTTKVSAEAIMAKLSTEPIKAILAVFVNELAELEATDVIEAVYKSIFDTLRLEKQLLAEIHKMDTNKDFYYSVPVEDRLAIEFNENDKKLNTLMNPRLFYDINNVNNSFVISKLDIDYTSRGIQIARSSRLS